MAAREVPQMLTQAGLSVIGGRLGAALGRARLSHHNARPAPSDPEPLLDALHRDPPTVRGHHFPSASSLSIALSSSASSQISHTVRCGYSVLVVLHHPPARCELRVDFHPSASLGRQMVG